MQKFVAATIIATAAAIDSPYDDDTHYVCKYKHTDCEDESLPTECQTWTNEDEFIKAEKQVCVNGINELVEDFTYDSDEEVDDDTFFQYYRTVTEHSFEAINLKEVSDCIDFKVNGVDSGLSLVVSAIAPVTGVPTIDIKTGSCSMPNAHVTGTIYKSFVSATEKKQYITANMPFPTIKLCSATGLTNGCFDVDASNELTGYQALPTETAATCYLRGKSANGAYLYSKGSFDGFYSNPDCTMSTTAVAEANSGIVYATSYVTLPACADVYETYAAAVSQEEADKFANTICGTVSVDDNTGDIIVDELALFVPPVCESTPLQHMECAAGWYLDLGDFGEDNAATAGVAAAVAAAVAVAVRM